MTAFPKISEPTSYTIVFIISNKKGNKLSINTTSIFMFSDSPEKNPMFYNSAFVFKGSYPGASYFLYALKNRDKENTENT